MAKLVRRTRPRGDDELRTMFQLGAVAIAQADVGNGRLLRVNSKFCELTGYSAEELLSLSFSDLTHPDDRATDWSAFRQMVAGMSVEYVNEKRYVREDGALRWVQANATLVGDNTRAIAVVQDITARRAAEDAVRESEREARQSLEDLDMVYQTAPVGLCLIDRNLRYLRINEHLAKINGIDVEAHIGRTLRDVLGSLADILEPIYRRVLDSGQPALEVAISGRTRASDCHRDWLASYYPVRRGDSVIGVNAVVVDVTAQRRLEQALRRSEARFCTALQTSPVTVFDMDRELRYQWVYNPGGGFTAEQMAGRTNAELIGAAAALELDRITADVLARGVGRHGEIELWVGGKPRFYDYTLEPVRDERGDLVGITGAAIDISDRKRLEADLREREARLRAMIDANPIGVILGDIHGRIVEANDAFLKIVGYDRRDLIDGALRWDTITPPEQRPLDAAGIAEATQRGICTPYEKHYVRKDGSRVPVLVGYALLGAAREQSAAFILDLSKQKKAQEQLEAALRQTTRLLEQQAVLLHEINHRVKNSLQLVSSMLGAQVAGAADPVLRDRLTEAQGRVITIAKLHEQLARRPDRVDRIEVGRYIYDLCVGLEQTLLDPQRRIAVRVEAEPADIPVDRAMQIALILSEAVTNAAKHAFPDGRSGSIIVRFEKAQDGSFRFVVADDGRGLPANAEHPVSSGLGMRMIAALVKNLGAKLQVESSGAGTRFTMTMPADG